jgi:serine/threonine-protein kinase
VVGETVARRGDQIKEYNIGVEVYKRPPGYDPKVDAIVRVEAGRLRSKLAKYYVDQGATDPVRIELPRGTYVPVLLQPGLAEAPPVETAIARQTSGRKPVLAIGLAATAAIAAILSIRGTSAPDRSRLAIAVLPLVNVAGDADTARFCTGLAQELTSAIARDDAFLVASRTESDQLGESRPGLAKAGRRVRVNAVLEVSVQRDSERFRVTVQLVSSRHGYHVWSQKYASLPGRAAAFQENVSNLIARTLRARFGGLSESRFGVAPAHNEEAMALYLKGQEAWLTQRRAGLLESLEHYKRSIEKDPSFAKPYEGIAASELFLASLEHKNADEHLRRAKASALKAIALDDRLADAHARLGNILLRREWNFIEAERELQRSVVLDPGSSPITRWYSEAARLREKYADARAELENGLLANPSSEIIETEFGMLDFQLDRVTDAEAHMRRALAGHPSYRPAHLLAGLLHERAGRFVAAENELRSCSNESELGRLCLAGLGHVYGVERKTREAIEVARQIEAVDGRSISLAALVYLGMADRNRALDALEQAYTERDKFLPLVKIDPRFSPLLFEPRFRALMGRLGLPTAVQ